MLSFPNAKINLGLHIIKKRDDGYHTIESVFYPIPLCDVLEVIACKQQTDKKVVLHISGIPVSGNMDDNLVVKAYQALNQDYPLPSVSVYLHKLIPSGAGLGGGSSDAASMLVLLNSMFELNLTTHELMGYASSLGSDCAFFIQHRPAYLLGKGHELEPYAVDLSGLYLVLIKPPVHSDTASAYRGIATRGNEGITLKDVLSNPVHVWKNEVENDFEPSLFTQYPELGSIKSILYECGAMYASMSGSGSAIYGLFESKPDLPYVLKKQVVFEGVLPKL